MYVCPSVKSSAASLPAPHPPLGVGDVGEHAALGRLFDESTVWSVDQDDHRTGGLLDDLLDQTTGVLGAFPEPDERATSGRSLAVTAPTSSISISRAITS
jgi:hypothetical protein